MYRCVVSSCQGRFSLRRFYTTCSRLRPSLSKQPSSTFFTYLRNNELLGICPNETASTTANMTLTRCMSGHGHKTDKEIDLQQKSTMNDLPVPQGSWQESFYNTNRANNIFLGFNSALLMVTGFIMYKLNCFSWNSGPNIKSIPIKPEAIGLTGADTAATEDVVEESSVGPDLDVVPAEEPAASAPTEEPITPTLAAEESAAPAPAAEEPAAPTPVAEEPAAPTPVVEEPAAPTPVVEEPAAPTSAAEEPAAPPTEDTPPPPAEDTPPAAAPETPKVEATTRTAEIVAPESKASLIDWSQVPDIPAHVPYLLVGAGTASFAAFS